MSKMHPITRPGIAGLALVAGLLAAAVLTGLPGLPGERPDLGPSASYIVQGESLADVRSAVQAAGGEITHELGGIRSIGARLTPKQRDALAQANGVVRLYADRSLGLSTKNSTETVADDFSSVAYDNNDGTRSWSGDWVEFNDDGTVDSGKVKVKNGRLQLKKRSRGVHREVDLSGSTSATLTYSYRCLNLVSEKEYVSVELSGDGGVTWTEVDRLAGPANDLDYQSNRIDITEFANANTRLRFSSSRDFGKHPVFVDEVKIVYTVSLKQPAVDDLNAFGSALTQLENVFIQSGNENPSLQDLFVETHYPTLMGANLLHRNSMIRICSIFPCQAPPSRRRWSPG